MIDKTTSSKESSRRFVIAFFVSLGAMLLSAIIYMILENQFVFDWRGQLAEAFLILVVVVVGLWLIRKGEKHAGVGVLLGALFGLILGLLAIVMIGLLFVAYPASGN